MAHKMRAAVVHEFGGPLRVEEVDVPEVRPGRIVVEIEASGVCHTDLHAASGDWPVKPTLPFVPGHEGVGHVSAVGAGVESVKEGDRVGVPWLHTACGCCKHCISGWETLCGAQQNTGYSVDGGFAEYVLADPRYVGRIPDRLESAAAAPILCAGVTVYKGLKETDTRPGDTVVVSGIGGLGHLAVQYAKAMGLHVIAVDVAAGKLELARDGADLCSTPRPGCGGGGAAGVRRRRRCWSPAVSPRAFEPAVAMLGRRGTMALIGLPPGPPLSIFDMVLNPQDDPPLDRRHAAGSDRGAGVCRRGQGPMSFLSEKLEVITCFDDARWREIKGPRRPEGRSRAGRSRGNNRLGARADPARPADLGPLAPRHARPHALRGRRAREAPVRRAARAAARDQRPERGEQLRRPRLHDRDRAAQHVRLPDQARALRRRLRGSRPSPR